MKPLLVMSLLLGTMPVLAAEDRTEKFRYLRPAQDRFVTECEFIIASTPKGRTILSTTYRGNTQLKLTAIYEGKETLTSAEVVVQMGTEKQTATATVARNEAQVVNASNDRAALAAPPGVIVTSAPDWTDTFMLCRKYDRSKGGKQEFPALWLHPKQKSLALTFSIERVAQDAIEHEGKKTMLDRFAIRIRNNSAYAAWADGDGTMIKLVPLPFRAEATNWLVREGYEKSAAGLRPPAP
jgi:hypothetical protein